MKKSTKAALLSALVFPGAGHIFLKKYILGALLGGISIACVYYLMQKAVERALEISEKILTGAVNPDIATIMELVTKQTTVAAEAQLLDMATTAIVVCWIIGILDSFRVGLVRDRSDEMFTKEQA